jgi:hypothetical protein
VSDFVIGALIGACIALALGVPPAVVIVGGTMYLATIWVGFRAGQRFR